MRRHLSFNIFFKQKKGIFESLNFLLNRRFFRNRLFLPKKEKKKIVTYYDLIEMFNTRMLVTTQKI